MTEGEPIDVLNYKKSYKYFPHQSTADQWFQESQFESYRALGYCITAKIIDTALKQLGKPISVPTTWPPKNPLTVAELFKGLSPQPVPTPMQPTTATPGDQASVLESAILVEKDRSINKTDSTILRNKSIDAE